MYSPKKNKTPQSEHTAEGPGEEFRFIMATARIAGIFSTAKEAIENQLDSFFPEMQINKN